MDIRVLRMAIFNPSFKGSYARLFAPGVALDEHADAFFIEFYRRFLASERVGALFAHTDKNRQITLLKHSLFYIDISTLSYLVNIVTICKQCNLL